MDGFLTEKYFGWLRPFQPKLIKILQEVDNDNKDCALEGDVEDNDGDKF